MSPSLLTPDQLSALEAKLVARRTVLRAEVKARLNAQDDPELLGMHNRTDDMDDWAVADLEMAMDVAEVSRDTEELREVEAALARIRDNTYGTCLECGAPIPLPRLDAYPMAARCIACQERLEAAMRRTGAGTI